MYEAIDCAGNLKAQSLRKEEADVDRFYVNRLYTLTRITGVQELRVSRIRTKHLSEKGFDER